jgi:hypothetical protein
MCPATSPGTTAVDGATLKTNTSMSQSSIRITMVGRLPPREPAPDALTPSLGRFGNTVVTYEHQRTNLTALIQSYLATMQGIGAETWLMHGTLLGWWWNRRALAWDTDADVMMSEHTMSYVAQFYNVSMHRFEMPETGERKTYMLEVNPHWVNPSKKDIENLIDARWIDTSNGLFIDITVLRKDLVKDPDGSKGMMTCKDRHTFLAKDIFPLRDTVFEGRPAKIPYAYTDLLRSEYGPSSLTKQVYLDHLFVRERGDWFRDSDLEPETLQEMLGDDWEVDWFDRED